MIACYAWTDTQIINMIQVMNVYYPDHKADLFVLKLDRISETLLKEVEVLHVFDHVQTIFPKQKFAPGRPLLSIPGIKTMIMNHCHQIHVRDTVYSVSPAEVYKSVLLPGFWAESLSFLRSISKQEIPPVYFVEEGMYSYVKNSFRCRIDSYWKDIYERLFRYRGFYFLARQKVKGIFVYQPDSMIACPELPRLKLPAIELRSSFWQLLLAAIVPREMIQEYRQRKYIYLVGALKPEYEPTYDRTKELISQTIATVGGNMIAVRMHPKDREALQDFSNMTFVDRDAYWFEGLGAFVDLSNKVLVTRNSSAISAMINMGVAPKKIILTYKLYDFYRKYGDYYRDKLVEQLKSIATIRVPATLEELQRSLQDE